MLLMNCKKALKFWEIEPILKRLYDPSESYVVVNL
jgi:hypothetical protein